MTSPLVHTMWMLVLHLTLLSCQGERCQTLSSAVVPVEFFATQTDCKHRQRAYHADRSAVQELETVWAGTLRQRREWTCDPETDERKDP